VSPALQLVVDDPATLEACRDVCRRVRAAGGRAFAVGGCVRDSALGRSSRELDIEVFGIAADLLRQLLGERFGLSEVGRFFEVMKLHRHPIDVALPREGDASPEQAASRRDFTVNSIYLDPLTDEVVDPFDGRGDLERGILRHTSERFAEDPLRVLRGMQLTARFELEVAPETVALCRGLSPDGVARERVFEEWRKLVCDGIRPSIGLAFLRDCGWLQYTPELEALIDCEQDPRWHPEGDVWIHTLHCMDAFAEERIGDAEEDLIVGLAVLCHDLGKPATTAHEQGRVTSKGHEPLGAELTVEFLKRMTDDRELIDDVPPLVADHLAPSHLYKQKSSHAAVRRLARRVRRIDRLVRVARADHRGRPPKPFDGFPAGDWLLAQARELEVADSVPRPIILGRHLIELGLSPGTGFRPILDACYTAQIEGEFATVEGGLDFARAVIRRSRD